MKLRSLSFSSRTLVLMFFATLFLGFTLSLSGAPAYADDGDAGTGGNPLGNGAGDGCDLKGWRYASRFTNDDPGHGADPIITDGNADGRNCSNNFRLWRKKNTHDCTTNDSDWKCMKDVLTSMGAKGCVDNASDVVYIMYVVDYQPSWATSFTNGVKNETFKESVVNILNKDKTATWLWNKGLTNAQANRFENALGKVDGKAEAHERIIDAATKVLYDKDNAIICVWINNYCDVKPDGTVPQMNLGLPVFSGDTWRAACMIPKPSFDSCVPAPPKYKQGTYTIPGSDRVKYFVKIKKQSQNWNEVSWKQKGGSSDKTFPIADKRDLKIEVRPRGRNYFNKANPVGNAAGDDYQWVYSNPDCGGVADEVTADVSFYPEQKSCVDTSGNRITWYTGAGTWIGSSDHDDEVTWTPSETGFVAATDPRAVTVSIETDLDVNGQSSWTYTYPAAQAKPASCGDPNQSASGYPYIWRVDLLNGGPHPGPTKFTDGLDWKEEYTPMQPVLDSLNGTTDHCQGVNKIATAEAATKTAVHPSVNASGSNRTAMAEGGIMNVREQTRYVTMSVYEYTEYFYDDDGNITGSETTCTYTMGSLSSPVTTGFWQALTVHCNAGGFGKALAARASNSNIGNGDDRKWYSGSAVSEKTTTLDPVWGTGATGAGTPTTYDGFFNKQCSYTGKKSDNSKQPTPEPIRANWTFFRDNEFEDLGVNLYEPVSTGVVSYNGDRAIRTLLTRWEGGTPNPLGLQAGEFDQTTREGVGLWSASDAEPYVLKNWSTSETGSAKTWALLSGEQTAFKARADWASENNAPNVFQVKWEYRPDVDNTFPMTNIGYALPGGGQTYGTGNEAAPIQGWVYSGTNGNNTPPLPLLYQENSGSETPKNRMDNELLSGEDLDVEGKWVSNPNSYSPFYYYIKFVRSVSE